MLPGLSDKYHFILASKSPRRQQLLREAGLVFDVKTIDYEESFPVHLQGSDIAEYLSREKALQFRKSDIGPSDILITADTVVWCNGKVLDKPSDYKEAFDILSIISGNTHDVITGVTLLSASSIHTFSELTKVTFDRLTKEEIDFYIENYKPFDKAGGYGIQEWIGIIGNSHINGSYFNVMGLPVNRLLKELRNFIQTTDKSTIRI
jgi:septum formation protein